MNTINMNTIFHYPPELLKLLSDALPKLCRSKKDVLLFFEGAGISEQVLSPYILLHQNNKDAFKKHQVVQEILVELNRAGEKGLRDRREVLKRVVEFQDFSVCWDSDQAIAKGLVAQIRELVNVKDTFTRINIERQKERNQRLAIEEKERAQLQKKKQEFDEIKNSFFSLFRELNPYRRGKEIEGVLNRLFKHNDILVSEAITLKGNQGSGVIEQIDGVIQLNGQLYLVEVKWEQDTLGRDKVAPHLVRVFSRSLAGAIFISYSNFSDAAIQDCKEALRDKVIVLCKISEFVYLFENEKSLIEMLQQKINAAAISKNPWLEFGVQ